MPVKRRKAKDRKFEITPEILDLWQVLTGLIERDKAAGGVWEDQGGCHRALLDASSALHRALGRKPWQWTVEHAVGDRPEWRVDDTQLGDYREAVALRLELVTAAKRRLIPARGNRSRENSHGGPASPGHEASGMPPTQKIHSYVRGAVPRK